MTLLRVGFTWPALLPGPPVRSYRTGSTLPSSSPLYAVLDDPDLNIARPLAGM